MLLEHQGRRPKIHESACIAPTAVICGDENIGPHTQIAFGVVAAAAGGSVVVGT